MPDFPKCTYIKTNGTQCKAIALKAEPLCYFHHRDAQRQRHLDRALDHRRCTLSSAPHVNNVITLPDGTFNDHTAALFQSLDLPPLEDADAVQVAISIVLRALATQQLDRHTAAIMLYGIQIASGNLERLRLDGNIWRDPAPHAAPAPLPEPHF